MRGYLGLPRLQQSQPHPAQMGDHSPRDGGEGGGEWCAEDEGGAAAAGAEGAGKGVPGGVDGQGALADTQRQQLRRLRLRLRPGFCAMASPPKF